MPQTFGSAINLCSCFAPDNFASDRANLPRLAPSFSGSEPNPG